MSFRTVYSFSIFGKNIKFKKIFALLLLFLLLFFSKNVQGTSPFLPSPVYMRLSDHCKLHVNVNARKELKFIA